VGVVKRKFIISVCFIIALTLSNVHFVHAEGSNCSSGNGLVADCYKSKDAGSKSKTTHATQNNDKSKADGAVTVGTDGPSTFMTFLKLIFSLAIILGLIYLLYRVVAKRTRTYKNDGAIKNVGGVSVGTNRSVQLIRIGEEILVVGVGDTVNLIKEITDPEMVESLLNQDSDEPDVIQKNVSKVVHWAKERAGKIKPMGGLSGGLPKTFDQQLKQLLKKRTQEVEKRLGKDSKDDARN
jgi:flagellar protein FliO/FliZ